MFISFPQKNLKQVVTLFCRTKNFLNLYLNKESCKCITVNNGYWCTYTISANKRHRMLGLAQTKYSRTIQTEKNTCKAPKMWRMYLPYHSGTNGEKTKLMLLLLLPFPLLWLPVLLTVPFSLHRGRRMRG